MSSGFVPAGSTEQPPADADADEWNKAQQEVAAARESTLPTGQQEGGKSLFEHLQANKAKKQEAFEEATKLRNQFRSLDDDEVDFLDSVLESTRARDAEVKKDTLDQLAAFRKQREEAERVLVDEAGPEELGAADASTEWSAGPRKRKKGKEGSLQGLKVRKTSNTEEATSVKSSVSTALRAHAKSKEQPPTASANGTETSLKQQSPPKTTSNPPPRKPPSAALGLGGYSSDED